MPIDSKSRKLFQILDENGNVNEKMMPDLSHEQIKKMYGLMVLARVFDETALKLQREGRILTYAPGKGQEAAQIGSSFVLQKEDWMFPSFRENAAFLVRGMPAELLYQYWAGDERGNKIPEGLNCFTVAVPVSTQIPHAVGAAWAMKLRKERNVSMVYFGDGATSKGDFHESLNFAGVFQIPVVFVCQNNQWAISFPRKRQTASETIAQKADAYGFEGVFVDGNDVFAVYAAAKQAIEKARSGKGATLIECYTYRLADHTTADDSSRYRTQQELEEWKKKDPILRLEKFMFSRKMLDENEKKKIWEDASKKISEAVKSVESVEPMHAEEIFQFTFEKMDWSLKEQMDEMITSLAEQKEVIAH